ncbi:hypothetical protein GMD78_04980 [Ornithinibacillus sp. L9]|uniref:Uncharacterized protein n=1 Tax=Ornithinibacillus caprae TaxID=2678566 RepID=A0A6N8FEB7_9BACI|nr:hypothetical protein [Ornithinibacillus caprae]MUK87755.1 hypothetical protein [Ornithinibacillus caprae]
MIYMYVITGIILLVYLVITKHMERRTIYNVWVTIICIELVADLILWNIMELYYFAGDRQFDFGVMLIKFLTAPIFGILFLNYMPDSFSRFIAYWVLWTAFTIFFEWTAVYFDYITYTGWNLWYSSIFYILIFPFLRWHYYYVR